MIRKRLKSALQAAARRLAQPETIERPHVVSSPQSFAPLGWYRNKPILSVAIDRLAAICAAQEVQAWRGDKRVAHPVLDLIGDHGIPGPDDDAFSFWERHFQRMDIYGNDIWLVSGRRGAPTMVQQMPMEGMTATFDGKDWEYSYMNTPLLKDAVIHFRRSKPGY